jgi:MFS family permease
MEEQLPKEQHQGQIGKEKIWTRDFIFILFANFFIFLGFQMTLPTIPLFVEKLGGNDQLIGFVVGIFTFSALLLRPFAGHALESRGRGFVYIFGLCIFIFSVGSYAFAMSILFLFVMRIVQGVGWGYSTTASGTIATDLIPPKRRGEGMGFFGYREILRWPLVLRLALCSHRNFLLLAFSSFVQDAG